jgi:ABC-type lipoprotein export system ATPase subunit
VETSNAASDVLAKIRRKKIGYVYQSFNLIPILTAKENQSPDSFSSKKNPYWAGV